jgi:hypothetical protein
MNKVIPNKTARLLTPPSLFVVSKKLIAVCENRHTQAADIYRLICLDPVLFSVTRDLYDYFYPDTKNYYNSIAKIIITLNLNTIKNYLLDFAYSANSLIEAKQVSAAEITEQKKHWRHTHGIAIAMRFIAKAEGVRPEQYEKYYAAGLLHDIDEYIKNNSRIRKRPYEKALSIFVDDAHRQSDDKTLQSIIKNELKSSEIFLGIRGE